MADFFVDWNFTGQTTRDAMRLADKIANTMEAKRASELTSEIIEDVVASLGDGWDRKSVLAVVANCSFEVTSC